MLIMFKGITRSYFAPYLDPHGEEDLRLERGLALKYGGPLTSLFVTHSNSLSFSALIMKDTTNLLNLLHPIPSLVKCYPEPIQGIFVIVCI